MPNLYVRNVPDELYERIQKRAQAQGTSVAAQVVSLLKLVLEDANQSQAEILASIRRRRFFKPGEAGAPDSTSLLRDDRQR
jgi:antitoxin FitA